MKRTMDELIGGVEVVDPDHIRTRRSVARQAEKRKAEALAFRRKVILVSAAIILPLGNLVLNWQGESGSVPRDLQGMWATAHPDYAGRGFKLLGDRVEFYAEPSRPASTFPILRVGRTTDDGWDILQLTVGDEKSPQTLSLRFDDRRGITFVNQPEVIWVKGEIGSAQQSAQQLAQRHRIAQGDTVAMAPRELPPAFVYCVTKLANQRQSDEPMSCMELLRAWRDSAAAEARRNQLIPAERDTSGINAWWNTSNR